MRGCQHQVEQWREGLPQAIQRPDDHGIPAKRQFRAASSPSHAVCAPLVTSVKTRAQPTMVSAACGKVKLWSTVDTRVYPTYIARPPGRLFAAA